MFVEGMERLSGLSRGFPPASIGRVLPVKSPSVAQVAPTADAIVLFLTSLYHPYEIQPSRLALPNSTA